MRPSRGDLHRQLFIARRRQGESAESARRVRRVGRHRRQLDHLRPSPVLVPRRALRQPTGPRKPFQSKICAYAGFLVFGF